MSWLDDGDVPQPLSTVERVNQISEMYRHGTSTTINSSDVMGGTGGFGGNNNNNLNHKNIQVYNRFRILRHKIPSAGTNSLSREPVFDFGILFPAARTIPMEREQFPSSENNSH